MQVEALDPDQDLRIILSTKFTNNIMTVIKSRISRFIFIETKYFIVKINKFDTLSKWLQII